LVFPATEFAAAAYAVMGAPTNRTAYLRVFQKFSRSTFAFETVVSVFLRLTLRFFPSAPSRGLCEHRSL
jgi:hypothetical protein